MVNQGLNLSLNELRLIAEHRNISDYENKSAKDLIKALRGSRPRLGIKKNTLKEIKEDFYILMHAFSKKDADKYRKLFYDINNYRHLSELEKEEKRKKFNQLEKSLNFKKLRNNINAIHYEGLNPIQDGRGGAKRPPSTSFSPVTSTNVGFGPQSFLTFSFNLFATLVQISSLYLVPVPNY